MTGPNRPGGASASRDRLAACACWMSGAEWVGAAACAATFIGWNIAARGGVLTAGVIVFFSLLCLTCVIAGRLLARLLPGKATRDFPTVFVLGFLTLNSALYLLAWISPFGIIMNAVILLGLTMAVNLAVGGPSHRPGAAAVTVSPALATLAISLIAATFWSWDSIAPILVHREGVLARPFFDSYFHTCEIRMFRDAHGAATLSDLRMAGAPVWIYHHASYLAAALVSSATGTTAYLAFGSFYVPAGLLMSGLAAHALIRSLWGPAAGFAAAVAVLLVPDAASNFHIFWLSYHWLQQINPGGYTGVAMLALAWLFMFAGCRTGRLRLVALGLLTAGFASQYKAQFFVANALLIWLYPGVFLRGPRRRWKLAWLVFALTSFLTLVVLSRHVDSVPTLRFDWSSLKRYMTYTGGWSEYASTHRLFDETFSPATSLFHDVAWGAALLFWGSLGFMGLADLVMALVVLARRVAGLPRRVELEYVLFPLLIIVNYLVMALGLAFDEKNPAHSEELRHRPMVWAYFIAAAWAGSLTYRLILGPAAARWTLARGACVAAVLLLLIVPYECGEHVQAPSLQWRAYSFQNHPRGFYESARYIRENAEPGELAQDADLDPLLKFSAFCEHPAYVCAYFDGKPDPVLARRIEEIEMFKRMTDIAAIQRFAAEKRIRFVLIKPRAKVLWPDDFLRKADFSWGGFHVFRFSWKLVRGRVVIVPGGGG